MEIENQDLNKVNSARSYGEAMLMLTGNLETAQPFIGISKELENFHKLSLEKLGFEVKDPSLPFYPGFISFAKIDDEDTEFCWTYYRVLRIYFTYNDNKETILIANDGKRFKFNGFAQFTKDFMAVHDEGIIRIYHLKPLDENIVFQAKLDCKWFIIIQKDNESLFLIYHTGSVVSKIFISRRESRQLKDLPPEYSNVCMNQCGSYGFYLKDNKIRDRLFLLDYLTDREIPMISVLTTSSGMKKVKSIYPGLDAIYVTKRSGFVYDLIKNKVAWIFFYKIQEKIYDSFIICDGAIFDIITYQPLLILSTDEKIYDFFLTRSDDGSGYHMWREDMSVEE